MEELRSNESAAVTQGGEEVTRLAHNQENAGATPAPATTVEEAIKQAGFELVDPDAEPVKVEDDAERIGCPLCQGGGKIAIDKVHFAKCPPCKGTGKRLVSRVGLDIVMTPEVRLKACKCGKVLSSPDPNLVNMARQGKELPPVECSTCGTVLIARRNLVLM